MTKRNNLFVFILGMHRSGSSCLAGCLERSGLYLSAVRRTGRFNAKGYYELKAIERIHEQILRLNGGSWDSPPLQVEIHSYHQQALQQWVEKLTCRQSAGLKDPRLLLLLESWLAVITVPHALVGTFRHPLAVANSLAQRNSIPLAEGIALWLHYNRALVRFHQASPFPLVEFDLADTDAYCRTVWMMASTLGLSPSMAHLRHFVSRDLEHYSVRESIVPSECYQVYAYLQEHALPSVTVSGVMTGSQSKAWLSLHDRGGQEWFGALQEAFFLVTHSRPAWLEQSSRKLRPAVIRYFRK